MALAAGYSLRPAVSASLERQSTSPKRRLKYGDAFRCDEAGREMWDRA